MSTTNSTIPLYYDADREAARAQRRSNVPGSRDAQSQSQSRYQTEKPLPQLGVGVPSGAATDAPVRRKQYRDDGYGGNLLDPRGSPQPLGGLVSQEPVERYYTPNEDLEQTPTRGQYSSQQQQWPTPTLIPSGNYSSGGAGGRDEVYDSPSNGYNASAYSRTEALPQQQGASGGGGVGGMRPANRKFEYDQGGHGGSSSATRRVMDFFRRRGREREG